MSLHASAGGTIGGRAIQQVARQVAAASTQQAPLTHVRGVGALTLAQLVAQRQTNGYAHSVEYQHYTTFDPHKGRVTGDTSDPTRGGADHNGQWIHWSEWDIEALPHDDPREHKDERTLFGGLAAHTSALEAQQAQPDVRTAAGRAAIQNGVPDAGDVALTHGQTMVDYFSTEAGAQVLEQTKGMSAQDFDTASLLSTFAPGLGLGSLEVPTEEPKAPAVKGADGKEETRAVDKIISDKAKEKGVMGTLEHAKKTLQGDEAALAENKRLAKNVQSAVLNQLMKGSPEAEVAANFFLLGELYEKEQKEGLTDEEKKERVKREDFLQRKAYKAAFEKFKEMVGRNLPKAGPRPEFDVLFPWAKKFRGSDEHFRLTPDEHGRLRPSLPAQGEPALRGTRGEMPLRTLGEGESAPLQNPFLRTRGAARPTDAQRGVQAAPQEGAGGSEMQPLRRPPTEVAQAAEAVEGAYQWTRALDASSRASVAEQLRGRGIFVNEAISTDAGIVYQMKNAAGQLVTKIALRGKDGSKPRVSTGKAPTGRVGSTLTDGTYNESFAHVTAGAQVPARNMTAIEELFANAKFQYGTIAEVDSFSMGGGLLTELARTRPDLYASVGHARLLNPALGPRDLAHGLPSNMQVHRMDGNPSDFHITGNRGWGPQIWQKNLERESVIGNRYLRPATSGVQNESGFLRGINPAQISTYDPMEGMSAHALENYFGDDAEAVAQGAQDVIDRLGLRHVRGAARQTLVEETAQQAAATRQALQSAIRQGVNPAMLANIQNAVRTAEIKAALAGRGIITSNAVSLKAGVAGGGAAIAAALVASAIPGIDKLPPAVFSAVLGTVQGLASGTMRVKALGGLKKMLGSLQGFKRGASVLGGEIAPAIAAMETATEIMKLVDMIPGLKGDDFGHQLVREPIKGVLGGGGAGVVAEGLSGTLQIGRAAVSAGVEGVSIAMTADAAIAAGTLVDVSAATMAQFLLVRAGTGLLWGGAIGLAITLVGLTVEGVKCAVAVKEQAKLDAAFLESLKKRRYREVTTDVQTEKKALEDALEQSARTGRSERVTLNTYKNNTQAYAFSDLKSTTIQKVIDEIPVFHVEGSATSRQLKEAAEVFTGNRGVGEHVEVDEDTFRRAIVILDHEVRKRRANAEGTLTLLHGGTLVRIAKREPQTFDWERLTRP